MIRLKSKSDNIQVTFVTRPDFTENVRAGEENFRASAILISPS